MHTISVFEMVDLDTQKRISLAELSSNFIGYKSFINEENRKKAKSDIDQMLQLLPSGSGIDKGMKFEWDESEEEKFVFSLDFHHTDEVGNYIKWTSHVITLTPSFRFGFIAEITGEDFNDIISYLSDLMYEVFED